MGKLLVSVDELGVDLLTMAGHKFSAPKGIGALYVRTGTPIRSMLHGADQEHGLRPGTENVALIVALGAAAALASAELPSLTDRLRALRDRLNARLADGVPGLQLNGHPELRLPNTLHVSFPGVSGRSLLAQVADRVATSVGMMRSAACWLRWASTRREAAAPCVCLSDAPRRWPTPTRPPMR